MDLKDHVQPTRDAAMLDAHSSSPNSNDAAADEGLPPSNDASPAATPPSQKGNKKRRSSISSTSTTNTKTYIDYCHEAIASLKDRTGSSNVALWKWMQSNYAEETTKPQCKRHFFNALKTGVKNGRFVKIKCSYKLNAAWKDKSKAKKKKESTSATTKKPKSAEETQRLNAEKLATLQATMTPEELTKSQEKMERQEAARKRSVELERKTKERADRLRKRRYPMEDTKLHVEDKELNVKPPADVISRPYLPYFFSLTRPFDDSSRFGKTPDKIKQASKVDGLDYGSFGLVPDLLQVYHFFRGDVHYVGDDVDRPLVVEFTLKHLVYSVEQIHYGNAKVSRMLPPLVTHLFVTCLSILCGPPPNGVYAEGLTKAELQLRRDLHKYLMPALTPASWADVCFLYMDAMERYATTDATRDANVLPCFNTDIEYLLGVKEQPTVAMTPFSKTSVNEETQVESAALSVPLPDGYKGYLGDAQSVLYRAYFKLAKQDPWNLSADEVMALLRALTDDILAMHPTIGRDLAAREEEMQSLLKAKRAADIKFRQVRLAFEGPKKAAAKKVVANDEKKDNGDDAVAGAEKEEKPDETFKPTASKKQFETAKKQQQKANDAYEKGIHKLVARTEPVGYDRNFNAVFCFRHDPEFLYVEDLRPPSSVATHLPLDVQLPRRSWHVIETTSLFDLFTSSLDIRGKREHDLYEELMGQGPQQSLRRFLYDDIKEVEAASNLSKTKASLLERLDAARLKCDEEFGRRSGRLAGAAEEELAEVESEIAALEKKMNEKSDTEPQPLDYEELTGLALLQKFDKRKGIDTRRSREKRALKGIPDVAQCSKLVPSGNIDGTGLIGIIVQDLLELEEQCQKLSPLENEGTDRKAWTSKLEEAVYAWNEASPVVIGPPSVGQARSSIGHGSDSSPFIKRGRLADIADNVDSSSKRQRVMSPQQATSTNVATSTSAIIALLRQPILALEERIADMTNQAAIASDVALADDNMSVDDAQTDQAQNEKHDRQWRKLIHQVGQTMTRKHVMIRELVVAAITSARKAHMPDVVAGLRASLLQYQKGAAGGCKVAALQVLEDHGGYDSDADEDEDEANDGHDADDDQEAMPSVLSADATFLTSSLGGEVDTSRNDWIEAVTTCKTIARLASLVAGFTHDASIKLTKMEIEHHDLLKAITRWEKDTERLSKNKVKKTSSFSGPSEVWADVRVTDDIVMVKAERFPWWPAKKCIIKDIELAQKLGKLRKSLVSLIGERGDLRIVDDDDIKPFTGKLFDEEEDFEVSKDIRSQLDDCLAMARRIIRGRDKMK
ncbi:hypothetical protein MPSEU_000198700 [Mayamaea pseudoterrestris]|nr:hypothetical protein MPSEU_000198700 [Mayamaea pseudoterrestris]